MNIKHEKWTLDIKEWATLEKEKVTYLLSKVKNISINEYI